MRLISFIANNRRSVGVLFVSRESVFPLEGYVDALSFLSAGEESWAQAANLAKTASREELISVSEVTLLSPLPRPGKILCIGVNYRDHAAETRLPLPKVPEVFTKFSSSIVPDGTRVLRRGGNHTGQRRFEQHPASEIFHRSHRIFSAHRREQSLPPLSTTTWVLQSLRRENFLDLLQVIHIVPGKHLHDMFHRLLAALGMHPVMLPLLRR